MNTIIEEIRKRIKAAVNDSDAAGDYDEYADGRGVGLAAALRIIDEVEIDHPAPSDVEEAADLYVREWHDNKREMFLEPAKRGFIAGAQYERERLMSGSLCGNVDMCGVSAWVKLPSKVLTDYLRSNFKEGDEVRVIIIKKEK